MPPTSLLRSRILRIALIYFFLFSAAILVLVGIIYWSTTESLSRQVDATIDAEIRGLAEQYQQRGLAGLVSSIRRRSTAEDASRGLYLVVDRNLAPLAGNLSRWPDEAPDADRWVTFPLEFPEAAGGGLNFGRARVFDLGDGLRLLVGHDLRERTRVALFIRETLAGGIAVVIVVSLIGGVLMSRSLLRDIERINATSRDIMAGDLSRRIPVSGRNDEFDRLAENLNDMLDRIEQLLEGMKQVSDNIAHDLRGPLTRLRSRLEVTLMEARSDEEFRGAIELSIAEADHLLETFKALLSIARAESGSPSEGFQEVDLAALVRDAGELFEPLAEQREQLLDVEIEGQAVILGDRHLLFQALSNLLDNAVKFAPEDSRISLGLADHKSESEIWVADRGPGVPADERARVQERFTRLEASRSTPGSGLGLALVAAVAGLHGGRLELADNRPGLRACLRLPRPAGPNRGRQAAPQGTQTSD